MLYDSRKEKIRRAIKNISKELEQTENILDETTTIINNETRLAVIKEFVEGIQHQISELLWTQAQYDDTRYQRELDKLGKEKEIFETKAKFLEFCLKPKKEETV
jgi:hypothetical protein